VKALAVAMATATLLQTAPSGWPQLLGPRRNLTTSELSVPEKPTLAEAWRRPVGAGVAAIVVSGGRAYTLDSDGEDDYLLALEAADGKDLWRVKIGKTHADAANGPGSTPAVAGDLVIAFGSSCRLAAFSTRDGKPAWDVDFAQVYKTRFAARGSCFISPLVHGDLVVLPTGAREGSRVVAFDVATGKPRWTAATEMSLNTNTSTWDTPGGPHLLYHYFKAPGTSGLAALKLADGTTTWTIDAESGMSNTAALALDGSRVLLQTWQGSVVIDATGTPRRLWSNNALIALPIPAVSIGGHIFGFGGNSGEYLTCVDAASGVTTWTQRTYRGAIVATERVLVMQSEGSGLLRLISADPSKYVELARFQTLKPGATTVTPPTIAANRIYVRNLEEIVGVTVR